MIDVISTLTGTINPRRYWSYLKSKSEQGGNELYKKILQFEMTVPDGEQRETDTFKTGDLLHMIQSIPSKKRRITEQYGGNIRPEVICKGVRW